MVRVAVDNKALVPLLRKMRSSRAGDNEILQEIALLQALHGWDWDVYWIPREKNDAADALSKNDMQRFERCMGTGMRELKVSTEITRPPMVSARLLSQSVTAAAAARGFGLHGGLVRAPNTGLPLAAASSGFRGEASMKTCSKNRGLGPNGVSWVSP